MRPFRCKLEKARKYRIPQHIDLVAIVLNKEVSKFLWGPFRAAVRSGARQRVLTLTLAVLPSAEPQRLRVLLWGGATPAGLVASLVIKRRG